MFFEIKLFVFCEGITGVTLFTQTAAFTLDLFLPQLHS